MMNRNPYRHRYPPNGGCLSGTACLLFLLCLHSGIAFAQEAKRPATRMQAMQAISTPDFGYLPTYVAKGRNFFAEEGLDLKLVVMNARVSVLALLNGEIQFAVGASSINAALRGSPLKAIFFFYNTSTWQFMVRPEIRNAEDLKGKVVAIGTVGSTTDLATRLIVKKFGLEPGRDVKLLPTGDARARILTMETGQAVGSLLNPDVAAEMASKGYRILISSAEVFPVPFSGIAANDQLIRTNPELIKRWMRAHLRAMSFIRQNPEQAAAVASKELKVDSETALTAIKLIAPAISADDPGGFTEKAMRFHLEHSAGQAGVEAKNVRIADIADVSLLRAVQREAGIQCKEGYLC
jgi:ABC-type nitrate/sulfonate/bicarbonate transport system substrate-binding protein